MMNRYYHSTLFVTLLVMVCALSSVFVESQFVKADHLQQILIQESSDQRLSQVFNTINHFPGSVGKDLIFLRTLSSVRSLHESQDHAITHDMSSQRVAVYSDLKNFMLGNEAYKELYVIRKGSDCVMRVTNIASTTPRPCSEVPDVVSNAYQEAHMLDLGEVYISPLTEYGGDPVLLYVTPVDEKCSIVAVIDANYFLEGVRRLSRDTEPVFLVDKDGSYIAHQDRSKEKLAGGTGNFFTDFPEVSKSVLSDVTTYQVNSGKEAFSFRRIYPTESNFAIYKGATRIDKGLADSNFWILVAISYE